MTKDENKDETKDKPQAQKNSLQEAKLEKLSQGHYLLKGVLSFKSVPELWAKNKTSLFASQSTMLSMDLSQLEGSDSSGLALLLEWYRMAQLQNTKIVFYNLPQQMYDIARMSGLDKILPLELKVEIKDSRDKIK